MRIKNVRAGIVIVSDAGLKLAPGQVVEISEITPQVSTAINAGMLAAVDIQAKSEAKKPETKPKAKAPVRTAGQKSQPKAAAEATTTPPAAPSATADSADDSTTEGADGSS